MFRYLRFKNFLYIQNNRKAENNSPYGLIEKVVKSLTQSILKKIFFRSVEIFWDEEDDLYLLTI